MEYNVHLEQPLLARSPWCGVGRDRTNSRRSCPTPAGVVRAQPIPGARRHVAVYLDDQINLEVGVELETPLAGEGEMIGSATPAGLVARTTHYGPYGQLHQAHMAIQRWCGQNGHTLAGPNWEIYGHWQNEWNRDPSKICTDLFYLLVGDGSSA